MSNTQRGKLILKEVPAGESEKKVVALLSKFAKSASVAELTEKVRNTPFALSNDIVAEKAALMINAFQKFGATATFIPHFSEKPIAEPFTPIESEPRFTFSSPIVSEKKPLPQPPEPKKKATRRLTMLMVTTLLILSLGYLAWQLWPILGDRLRDLGSYLKQLI